MKLATRYNRVNILTSIVVLLVTGILYYFVIHLILTNKLDKDLAVEENEIKQYTQTYQKLPLPASYLDQQVSYKELTRQSIVPRDFRYTTYLNPKENEIEPGRSLITTVNLKGKQVMVTITKSRVESEDLVRIILVITLIVTFFVLISLLLINRFVLNRLWQPFYVTLNGMKTFDVAKSEGLPSEPTKIDEFNELNTSVNAMAEKVRRDYKDLKSFTDNASHEMMTPLAVINSKLDSLLQTSSFSEHQSSLLEDVYQATGRLSRLHQSLLLLAKIENNLISDTQELDLKEAVSNKIRQFKELFERDGLQIEEKLSERKIVMSRYLADILLNNLFSNAVRYNIPSGRIVIELSEDSLSVSNTGKDMDPQRNLFDRFSKSVESEGLGLGLAICKQICNIYSFGLEYRKTEKFHVFMVYL
jgi:signal transduction histidine kinase